MRSRILFSLACIATASVLMSSSCKKNKGVSGSGVTEIVEASAGGTKLLALPLTPATESGTALTLKNTTTDGSGNVRVSLALDNDAVIAAGMTPLPANNYTMTTMEFDVPANGTVAVPITIKKTGMDLNNNYGIGFKINSVSGGSIAPAGKSIVVNVSLRNRWDGRYKMTGTFIDYSSSSNSYCCEQEYWLITTSDNQVKVFNKRLGIYGYIFLNQANQTYFSQYGLIVNFDAATNKITSVTNYYGQPSSNGRSAQLDPSGLNQWDPVTKTISIKHWLNQTGSSPHLAAFNDTWTYLGPR
jgi:hypothetical protein